jgi:salicylate hydroxylase
MDARAFPGLTAARGGRKPKVAVIGGGLGGLSLALALLQRECEVAVYEKSSDLGEIGAGISLSPNAIKVMRALGREERIRRDSFEPEATVQWDWQSGKPLRRGPIKGSYEARYGAPLYLVHRADLLNALAEAVPEGIVRLGKQCVGIREAGGSAAAVFADGSEAEADVVVGADGIHSTVRRVLWGADKPSFTGNMCWRGIVPIEALPREVFGPVHNNWHGPYGHVTHYFVRAGALVNFVAVRETPDWTEESWTTPSTKDELMAAFPHWHPRVTMLFERSIHYYKWGLFDRAPMPQWGRDRVTLLGDAAHPMLPFLGQGAASGMEDAFVLARLLAEQDDVAAALPAYEAERRPRTARMQLESRARGQVVQSHTRWEQLKRNLKYRLQSWIDPAAPPNQADWVYRCDVTATGPGATQGAT